MSTKAHVASKCGAVGPLHATLWRLGTALYHRDILLQKHCKKQHPKEYTAHLIHLIRTKFSCFFSVSYTEVSILEKKEKPSQGKMECFHCPLSWVLLPFWKRQENISAPVKEH